MGTISGTLRKDSPGKLLGLMGDRICPGGKQRDLGYRGMMKNASFRSIIVKWEVFGGIRVRRV